MKNIHLIISVIIVAPTAILYAFCPNILFEISPYTIDEKNVFKALMGLYLGFAFLWTLGILNPKLWKSATQSNIIFMFGLAFGRTISILMDGLPSFIFILGTIGEMILGSYAYFQLQKQSKL